jgi:hypothetical protein
MLKLKSNDEYHIKRVLEIKGTLYLPLPKALMLALGWRKGEYVWMWQEKNLLACKMVNLKELEELKKEALS